VEVLDAKAAHKAYMDAFRGFYIPAGSFLQFFETDGFGQTNPIMKLVNMPSRLALLEYLYQWSQLLENRTPLTDDAYAPLENRHQETSFYNFTFHLIVPSFEDTMQIFVGDLTRIMLALELYRIDKETLPETLDDLVPVYLEEIPKDIVFELPPTYEVHEESYHLFPTLPESHQALEEDGHLYWYDVAEDYLRIEVHR
jgi:hypothetical protein